MAKKNKKIESGTIIRIKLNFDLGYTFAKVVNMCDFSEIDLSTTLHYIIYPYNYIEKKENIFNYIKFIESKPLTGPLFVIDILYAIKNSKYQIVGTSLLRNYEQNIPDFRGFSSDVFAIHKYEKDATSWNYFEKGRPFKRISANYDQVKHLEGNAALSHNHIEKRLSMEVLNRKKLKIEDFYDMQDWINLKLYYNMHYTVPFNEVPNHIKGKAILW
ncbi:Imm26 family immunity protein [Polaribacter porphyrae]|uniref:Uncharacterized protein n=1 Tax=Polaribacter porphyrae TaxID=1137780 RepID=A0A2S7WQD1_9FLAO|nr:Imm26 family immunity protein [Polaribacter porphyrae]PQJ79646.1 hypothetical protein BTO18_10880 [Polaribacter porphyrae]